ncbi:MAG: TolC family protein [Bacteroidales bacterium]|nr:TolC family protein [Bacteroidales bacterium]
MSELISNEEMKLRYIFAALLTCCMGVQAQERAEVPVSADEFLALVCRGNLSLASEKLNVPIAQAEARAAAVFADPSLSLEYANNDDHRMQMGQSFSAELGYTISPGKRGARVNLAKSEAALAEALLEDYLRNLRLEASTAYYETVRLGELMEQARLLAEVMSAVAATDSMRHAVGNIRPADAMQTRLEANVAVADYIAACNDYDNARLALAAYTGPSEGAPVYYTPTGTLDFEEPLYAVDELVAGALERRADLVAALKNVDVARKALTVEGKERNLDFEVALGYNYNTEVRNELAPAPRFSGMTVGVTVPLPFSNSNKGALTAARLRAEQAEIDYQRARQEVQTQTVQAYNDYVAAGKRAQAVGKMAAEQSREVFEAYRRSYTAGDIDINDFLDIVHNYTDVATMAIDSRAARIAALLALRHTAAISE